MKIIRSVEISAAPEEVFPWLAEPEKAMQWQKNVKSGEVLVEEPGMIGTTFREEIEENGKSLSMEGVITDFIADKKISFHLRSKVHEFDVSYSLEGDDKKSVVHMDAKIKWKFPLNIMGLLFGRRMKNSIARQMEKEFQALKHLCEA